MFYNEFCLSIKDRYSIDGQNTFHGMGIIALVTPGTNSCHTVPRIKVNPQEISSTGHVKIQYWQNDKQALAELKYDDIPTTVYL